MFEDLNPQGLPTAILEIALLLAGAWLIGGIFGWLFFRARSRARIHTPTQEVSSGEGEQAWRKRESELLAQMEGLQGQLTQARTSLEKAQAAGSQQKSEWELALAGQQSATQQLAKELDALKLECQQWEAQFGQAENARKAAEQSLAQQKAEIAKLEAQLAQPAVAPVPSEPDGNQWQAEAEAKDREVQQLKERMRELQEKAASSSQGGEAVVQLREKLKLAEEASVELKQKLATLETQLAEPAPEPDTLNTRLIHKLTQERDQLRKEIESLRAAPPLSSADDLTLIQGITPELQTKLFAQGIRTFSALADLSELDRIRLDREFNLPPGTIKAQKWIKQAREFLKNHPS
jgi:predicted flap endonuclease-1-like 5' DNA nuclease